MAGNNIKDISIRASIIIALRINFRMNLVFILAGIKQALPGLLCIIHYPGVELKKIYQAYIIKNAHDNL